MTTFAARGAPGTPSTSWQRWGAAAGGGPHRAGAPAWSALGRRRRRRASLRLLRAPAPLGHDPTPRLPPNASPRRPAPPPLRRQGTVVATTMRKTGGPPSEAREVLSMGPGQYFGERHLLGASVRPVSTRPAPGGRAGARGAAATAHGLAALGPLCAQPTAACCADMSRPARLTGAPPHAPLRFLAKPKNHSVLRTQPRHAMPRPPRLSLRLPRNPARRP